MSQVNDNTSDRGGGKDSFLPLLISLGLMLILVPLSGPLPLLFTVLGSLVLLSGMLAVMRDRSFRMLAGIALLICLPLRWAAHFWGGQHPVLILLSHTAVGTYFMILAVAVLVRVIAHPRVTRQTVIGAICGYLLIGYIFTFGYSVLTCLTPDAIAVSGQSLGTERAGSIEQHIGELAYFSFITLTTVGYGDIAPVSPVARSMAILEALAGQLYLAAFVARLVGAMSKPDVRK